MTSSYGNWWAPALSAVILLSTAMFGLVGVKGGGADTDEFHDGVRTAMESIPYKIGPWVGSDVEAATAATRLLKPVKLMQRRYTNPATGRSFNLLMVYCGDTRDMLGHYPPNCYPAHGWKLRGSEPSSFELTGLRFGATEYTFSRSAAGIDQSLDIFNFFALPVGDARLVGDMDAVNLASQQRSGVTLGAAQVQLLFSTDYTPAEQAEIRGLVLSAIEPTLHTITAGVTDE